MKRNMVRKLACPNCRASLILHKGQVQGEEILTGTLKCTLCLSNYPIENSVAVLLPRSMANNRDDQTKLSQLQYHATHEPSPRPEEPQNLLYGTTRSLKAPRSHTDMYNFQLNRIRRYLPLTLEGKEVLDVGCGAGREAEYWACRGGASITGLDINMNDILAAKKRSKVFGYAFEGIVGDGESLPFKDKSFDISLIDTSLHHLSDPKRGIFEMARVSKEGFFLNESTDCLMIRVALSLGLTSEDEPDGTKIFRFSRQWLTSAFRELGISNFMLCRHFLNTSLEIRFGKYRRITRFLESEMALLLQDLTLGPIGNRMVAIAHTT